MDTGMSLAVIHLIKNKVKFATLLLFATIIASLANFYWERE